MSNQLNLHIIENSELAKIWRRFRDKHIGLRLQGSLDETPGIAWVRDAFCHEFNGRWKTDNLDSGIERWTFVFNDEEDVTMFLLKAMQP